MKTLFYCILMGILINVKADCFEESNVSGESLEKFLNFFSYNETDKNLKKYITCTLKKKFAIMESGEFDLENFLMGLKDIRYRQAAEKCQEQFRDMKNYHEEYAFQVSTCIFLNGPNKFLITMVFPCVEESKADVDLLKKVLSESKYDIDDETIKATFLCMFKRIGFVAEDGKLIKDVLINWMKGSDKILYGELFDFCVDEETRVIDANGAFEVVKCIEGPNKQIFKERHSKTNTK